MDGWIDGWMGEQIDVFLRALSVEYSSACYHFPAIPLYLHSD